MRPASALRPVQDRCVTHIYERDQSLVFARPGGGKTVVAYTALEEMRREGIISKVLISAPLRVCELVWPAEPAEWEHLQHLVGHVAVATGTLAERDAAVQLGEPYTVVNHENLLDLLHAFPGRFDALVLDELSKFKGGTSRRWQPLLKLSQSIQIRIGLTGSPAPNEISDLFGGVRVIDRGAALGRSFDKYRNEHYSSTKMGTFTKWEPRNDALEKTLKALAPLTFALQDSEWKPPPIRRVTVPVELPREIRLLYAELEENLTVETEEDVLLPGGAAHVQNKLLQLCAGFYYVRREGLQTGVRLHPFRLDAVSDIVAKQRGAPIAIVYDYVEQLKELKKRYPRAAILGKGTTRKSAQLAVKEWNDGSNGVLILHGASAGHGLNLQYGGSVIAWCSRPFNLDFYEQVIMRFARSGQTASETVSYETQAVNTVESKVLTALKRKGQTQDAVFNFSA